MAGELSPARIGYCASQATVCEHSGDIKVFDDEPIVVLDQRVGYLMQEVPADIRDVMVVPGQLGDGVTA
ncbi:MAG TPA: hypothetical protein VIQ11_13855, partial [Mycobacterium sp.]